MTESDWLSCTDPKRMLDFMTGTASERKLRLVGVGCWRSLRRPLSKLTESALRAVELFADGKATLNEVLLANEPVHSSIIAFCSLDPAEYAAYVVSAFKTHPDAVLATLRDLFGNPFRPFHIDPAWAALNDAAATRLAMAIYDERAFDRLPILADALEDAGCDDITILEHLRGPGPHVRGCFVLDLLLDKTR